MLNRKEDGCYECGDITVCKHHIYCGTGNRKISEKYGFIVWLCPYHHNASNEGVHFNKALDTKLRREQQLQFEKNTYTSRVYENYRHQLFRGG